MTPDNSEKNEDQPISAEPKAETQPAEKAPVETTAPSATKAPEATVSSAKNQTSQAKSQPSQDDPGKTMAIISIVMPFIGLSLVGLILAFIALSKSKKAGFKNVLAKVSIAVNAVVIAIALITITIAIIVSVAAVSALNAPVAASNTFTSGLADNDLAKAYSEVSSSLKAKYPTQAQFDTEYNSSGIGLKFGSITSKNINTENGVTTATIVYDAEVQGQQYVMTVKLVKENGKWLVVSIEPVKK